MRKRPGALAPILAWALAVSSCTSVARLTNLPESSCRTTVESQLASVLVAEGETPDAATSLARDTLTILTLSDIGPRPFVVAAPSGTDYSFFVEKKKAGCILRLYGRQKGFVSYTNNMTYIASRALEGCACAE
jgi:hypothetical protein